eukprot:SAG22_NODE_801_length_7103_cov_18.044832_2_plen_54_part_00
MRFRSTRLMNLGNFYGYWLASELALAGKMSAGDVALAVSVSQGVVHGAQVWSF